MRPRDAAELVLLGAIWGGSFLFTRIAVPAFGPFAIVFLRVAGATLLLLPLLVVVRNAQGANGLQAARQHWRALAIVGAFNSVIPFTLFAWAALTLEAGFTAVLNAATPLFAALVAWRWLGDRPGGVRVLGLVIGFGGVVWIVAERSGLKQPAALLPALACLAGAVSYAVAPSLTRRHLAGVPPLAIAAGSQVAAALMLAVPAVLAWPLVAPRLTDWAAVAALAFVCTGVAYVLYFRLIAHAGAQNAVSVTFLVPVFAIAWGHLVLHERLTWPLLAGSAVVLAGTAMATGIWPRRRAALPAST